MTRRILFLLSVFVVSFTTSKAQTRICATDEMKHKFLQEHPEMAEKIANDEALLERQIQQQIGKWSVKMDLSSVSRITGQDDPDSLKPGNLEDTLFIPVVAHIIHNYGSEDVTDDNIYKMIKTLNDYYQVKNDTAACVPGAPICGIVPVFKKFVGRANIYFKLATKDPNGNPTRGITKKYTYTTYGGDNGAKYDLWSPSNYMNIWIEAVIGQGSEGGGIVAAYSQLPPVGAADPYVDGLITAYTFIGSGQQANSAGYVVAHEVGHYFNLAHPFGDNNVGNVTGGCGDDGVDDTPPTTGEFGEGTGISQFYDTMCAKGYAKLYPSSVPGIDSIYDYPDTANVQNIMTYSDFDPELMFTKGQVARMRAALASDVAKRDTLWSAYNLARTGILEPAPDLPMIPDYSVAGGVASASSSAATGWGAIPQGSYYSYATTYNGLFVCKNQPVTVTNKSWNDTIQSLHWAFSNGASHDTSNSTTLISGLTFSQPGWVTVTMNVKGNNTAVQTLVDSQKIFVADIDNVTSARGYVQEFNSDGDMNKWPTFNYYNNNLKWQVNNSVGYYDHNCIEYTGYDDRIFPTTLTGQAVVKATSVGDYDDMFTPVFDLTTVKDNASDSVYLTFLISSTTRTGYSENMNDDLEISYNTACGPLWKKLTDLTKLNLVNQGVSATPYVPGWMGQWSVRSIWLPAAAITNNTVFRFRYKPGVDQYGNSTGNNFFMDRIHFATNKENVGVNTLTNQGMHVMLSPNPTNSNAYVLVADAANANINIQVTDITGKVVFTANERNASTASRIEIPHSAIAVNGIYMVHVVTDNQVHTEKLVVY